MAEHPDREQRVGAGAERAPWSYRGQDDDFRCLRFRVWYPSKDCAIRTKFKTSPGCLDCDQGRFNLRRHAPALRGMRVFVSVESA